MDNHCAEHWLVEKDTALVDKDRTEALTELQRGSQLNPTMDACKVAACKLP